MTLIPEHSVLLTFYILYCKSESHITLKAAFGHAQSIYGNPSVHGRDVGFDRLHHASCASGIPLG